MLGVTLDIRVRRTLAVTVDEGLELSLDETPTAYFPAHLSVPQIDNSSLDGSPRSSKAVWRLYWGAMGPALHACDRIEVPGDTTYELIATPKPVTNGRRTLGYSAPVLPVSMLYPRSAEVKAPGGAKALATIECSVYSQREEQRGRGEFHGTFAEAPPAAWAASAFGRNYDLHFADGSAWKILDATLGVEVPYVSLSLRKAG